MAEICLVGAGGRMGRELYSLDPELFVCGIDKVSNDGELPVFSGFDDIPKDMLERIDGILDFSNPGLFDTTLSFALENRLSLAVGTTGLSEKQITAAKEAGKEIPVLVTSNMSIGINAIAAFLPGFVKSLGSGYDIEIIEKHHNQKIDAPSGTALLLADKINEAEGGKYTYVFDRNSKKEARDTDEIGISSIRGGTIPGEHTVILAGKDEVIEIKHTAFSRAIFAQGALKAVRWLVKAKPRFYTFEDILINE